MLFCVCIYIAGNGFFWATRPVHCLLLFIYEWPSGKVVPWVRYPAYALCEFPLLSLSHFSRFHLYTWAATVLFFTVKDEILIEIFVFPSRTRVYCGKLQRPYFKTKIMAGVTLSLPCSIQPTNNWLLVFNNFSHFVSAPGKGRERKNSSGGLKIFCNA